MIYLKLWIDAMGSADLSLGLKAMELKFGPPLLYSWKCAIGSADSWMRERDVFFFGGGGVSFPDMFG
jgi:hypothetical protein